MTIFRCTQKLLRRLPKSLQESSRLKAASQSCERAASTSTTVLGDWYATTLIVNRIHYVLSVSARTRLCVVLPGRDKSLLVLRWHNSVESLLVDIGVPDEQVQREREAMNDIVFAATTGGDNYRSVLGSLNEFCYLAEPYIAEGMALRRLAMELSHTPCTPLGVDYPCEAALTLLANAYAKQSD